MGFYVQIAHEHYKFLISYGWKLVPLLVKIKENELSWTIVRDSPSSIIGYIKYEINSSTYNWKIIQILAVHVLLIKFKMIVDTRLIIILSEILWEFPIDWTNIVVKLFNKLQYCTEPHEKCDAVWSCMNFGFE